MRSAAYFVTFALTLAGCGGSTDQGPPPADSGTAAIDTPPAPPPPPPPPPPQDSGTVANVYPPRPYGTGIGAIFEPFTLTACNRTGEEATWRFDGPDFFTSNLTLISIAAAWCVPCQRESSQIQREIIDRYRGMGVRFIQILVQNVDRSAISASTCNAWANRYGISFPELMDPMFITSPYVPRAAFPGNVLIDRQGRIRWREYGSDTGLMSIRTAIEDVLAHPDP